MGPDGAIILVHGAWHDSWSWQLVADRLTKAGVETFAPDLPLRSLREDAEIVRAILDDSKRPFLVAGHSRGGIVASFATAGSTTAKHLVFVASAVLEEDQLALPDRIETAVRKKAVREEDGFTTVDKDLAADLFYADCDPTLAEKAVARLRATRVPSQADIAGLAVGWRTVPFTYVLCTNDQCVHPKDQRRMSARTTDVVEIAASHTPILSRPDDIAEILLDRARQSGVL